MNLKSIFILCLIYSLLSFQTVSFAKEHHAVEWKPWSEYSEKEKNILRARWSDKFIKDIVDALKANKPLPIESAKNLSEEYGGETLNEYRLEILKMNEEGIVVGYFYDLRGISFKGRNLDKVNLSFAQLQGADLRSCTCSSANLKGANLKYADLGGAILYKANLDKALLVNSNLEKASLISANLKNTVFAKEPWAAGLTGEGDVRKFRNGANLRGANLFGADLSGAIVLGADLQGANLFAATFGDTLVSAPQIEEALNYHFIVAAKGGPSMIGVFLPAIESIHREAKNFFRKEGMSEIAWEYHFWENEAKTRFAPWYLKLPRLLLLKWTYGYGARPIWLLYCSVLVIITFSVIFAFLTLPRKLKSGIYVVKNEDGKDKEVLLSWRKGLLIGDCFYFSLLSFATFGYGALKPRQWIEFFRLDYVEYKPVGWARIFVGIESALGIYIFALLATVLFGN